MVVCGGTGPVPVQVLWAVHCGEVAMGCMLPEVEHGRSAAYGLGPHGHRQDRGHVPGLDVHHKNLMNAKGGALTGVGCGWDVGGMDKVWCGGQGVVGCLDAKLFTCTFQSLNDNDAIAAHHLLTVSRFAGFATMSNAARQGVT